MNAGEQLITYLDECVPNVIVETGCLRRVTEEDHQNDGWSTVYIARWVKDHPGSTFFSVDCNPEHIYTATNKVQDFKLPCPEFTCAESVQYLQLFTGDIDFAYLDTCDGLEHGLDEFKAAAAHNAKMIVMDDYISKVRLAAQYAGANGWNVQQDGRFTVMRRV